MDSPTGQIHTGSVTMFRRGVTAFVCTALGVVALAAPASPLPPLAFGAPGFSQGNSHPYVVAKIATAYSVPYVDTNVDGLFALMTTPVMDVPTCYGPGVYPNGWYSGNTSNSCIWNANVRPTQVVYSLTGEWVAAGYTAGCFSIGSICTGIHPPDDGVYKRYYEDQAAVNPVTGGVYYTICFFGAVSTGDNHTFQIQRKYDGSRYGWAVYYDGSNPGAYTGGYTTDPSGVSSCSGQGSGAGPVWVYTMMHLGYSDVGAEHAQPDNDNQQLSMSTTYFNWINTHEYGDASANAPGLTNYVRPSGYALGQCASPGTAVIDLAYPYDLQSRGTC